MTTPASSNHQDVQLRLHEVSDSFCPLRWTYLQVDIQHARVRACCKTPFRSVSAAEFERLGPNAIFNTEYFQARRQEMLEGVRHADCDGCWSDEKQGLLSYRFLMSQRSPFRESIADIAASRTVDAATPLHIELILSTLCDLRCSYCSPEFSSAWEAEVRKYGPYPGADGIDLDQGASGFRAAFLRWLDEILERVDYVQFNGGEPLLHPEFFEMVDRIRRAASGRSPTLGLITNLNTPPARLEHFKQVLPDLIERHQLRFAVSQDSVGRRAEYIRFGIRWTRFDRNLRSLLAEFPELRVELAPTMSVLNVTSVRKLIEYTQELVGEFGERIVFRPGVVSFPDFLAPLVLPPRYACYLREAASTARRVSQWEDFALRLDELARALEQKPATLDLQRRFREWARVYDRRRGTDFPTVFPELREFWSGDVTQ